MSLRFFLFKNALVVCGDSVEEASIKITLPQIYDEVREQSQKIDGLAAAVGEMVAVNRRLDQHHDRLNDHGTRIGTVETQQAIHAAIAPRKSPWYSIVGGVVGIITGIAALVALLKIAAQLSTF